MSSEPIQLTHREQQPDSRVRTPPNERDRDERTIVSLARHLLPHAHSAQVHRYGHPRSPVAEPSRLSPFARDPPRDESDAGLEERDSNERRKAGQSLRTAAAELAWEGVEPGPAGGEGAGRHGFMGHRDEQVPLCRPRRERTGECPSCQSQEVAGSDRTEEADSRTSFPPAQAHVCARRARQGGHLDRASFAPPRPSFPLIPYAFGRTLDSTRSGTLSRPSETQLELDKRRTSRTGTRS